MEIVQIFNCFNPIKRKVQLSGRKMKFSQDRGESKKKKKKKKKKIILSIQNKRSREIILKIKKLYMKVLSIWGIPYNI